MQAQRAIQSTSEAESERKPLMTTSKRTFGAGLKVLGVVVCVVVLACISFLIFRNFKPLLPLALVAEPPEVAACRQHRPVSEHSSEDDPEPEIEAPQAGKKVRMPAFGGMPYQLFLPLAWKSVGTEQYPLVVFLHGAGDGKFSVMNSQSLPRLLAQDQSTSFDPRTCWCLPPKFARVTANLEPEADDTKPFLEKTIDLASPLADCNFADTFPAIVLMPQGWLPDDLYGVGWADEKLNQVQKLTQHILKEYRGDPTRVALSGQSAGGAGVWRFAANEPNLWSSVNVICAPTSPDIATLIQDVPIWVVGWAGDGDAGNDEIVQALKENNKMKGLVHYTRYLTAPAPPDPKYQYMTNHASYDLIYRDPRLWDWAFEQRNQAAAKRWGL